MSVTTELKTDLARREDKKENLVQSYGMWIQRREARWAEDAAGKAEHVFKMDIAHSLASRDAREVRAKEVA